MGLPNVFRQLVPSVTNTTAAMFLRAFFRRISQDFLHKELLPLKILFFVHSSTIFVLYPYLTIHMRELGINVEETAIMNSVSPVVAILMPPLAGMVADRIGNFKLLLSFFSAFGGLVSLLLLLVPLGRQTIVFPETIPLGLACDGGGSGFALTPDQSVPCNVQEDMNLPVNVAVDTCGFWCRKEDIEDVDLGGEERTEVVFALPGGSANIDMKEGRWEALEKRDFQDTFWRMAPDSFFFPAPWYVNFSCSVDGCSFSVFNEYSESDVGDVKINAILQQDNSSTSLTTAKDPDAVACATEIPKAAVTILKHSKNLKLLTLEQCEPRCLVTLSREDVCSNLQEVEEFDVSLTFWSYLSVRVAIGIVTSIAFAMFEGAVIAILREHNGDYGLQRIYATIGGMISSPLSGMLIDYASQGMKRRNFMPAFYLYAGLKIATAFLILSINLDFKPPAKNIVSDVFSILKNVEALALFVAIFVLGSAWGYIESFLFWLLQDLGSSSSLMGITITVGGVAGIPLLVLSGPIIDRIGHANVLVIGFAFYAVRLLGYSLIYNPWLCLIFEAMEGVTSSLTFTAAVTYAAKLSTLATDSSVQGLLGGLYFGVGKGAGSLVGGYLMKFFGIRATFQCFSIACAALGAVYFLFNKLYLRKRPQVEGNDIVKKIPKEAKETDKIKPDTGTVGNGSLDTVEPNPLQDVVVYDKLQERCHEESSGPTGVPQGYVSESGEEEDISEAYNINLSFQDSDEEYVEEARSPKQHEETEVVRGYFYERFPEGVEGGRGDDVKTAEEGKYKSDDPREPQFPASEDKVGSPEDNSQDPPQQPAVEEDQQRISNRVSSGEQTQDLADNADAESTSSQIQPDQQETH